MGRRIRPSLIVGVALSLTLAACGGGGGGAATGGTAGAASSASASSGGPLTSVTVGVLPIVDTAPIWLGVKRGIFADHGLDVHLEVAQGGAAVVPAVVSGDYEFGFSNLVSLVIAADQGLPLTLLAPANSTTGDPRADFAGIVVPRDSGITRPADLAGKTVAVNTLANIGEVTVKNVVEKDGGNPDSVHFVELGFPDMPAALAKGEIDAAWILEPFLTITKQQGARSISAPYAQTDPNLLIAGYFTSQRRIQQDPSLVKAFTAAMSESLTYAQAHPDQARAILSTYTDIDPAVQKAMVMPRFPDKLDEKAVQLVADLSLKYGLIHKGLDAASLLR